MTSDDLKASEFSRCPPRSNTGELGMRSRLYGRSTPTITAAWRRPAHRSIAGSRRRLGAFQELSSIRHLARYSAISGHRRRCGRARNALSGRVFCGNRDDRCVASPAAATGLLARSGAGFEAAWPRGHDRAGHELSLLANSTRDSIRSRSTWGRTHSRRECANQAMTPFDSNQALPTLLFATARARARVEQAVPQLKVVSNEWLSLFVYPLSGGFKAWCFWPAILTRLGLKVEEALLPSLGPLLAFRLMTVLERRE